MMTMHKPILTRSTVYQDDFELLSVVVNSLDKDEQTLGILSSIIENQKGLTIDSRFYDWDEIKPIFENY